MSLQSIDLIVGTHKTCSKALLDVDCQRCNAKSPYNWEDK